MRFYQGLIGLMLMVLVALLPFTIIKNHIRIQTPRLPMVLLVQSEHRAYRLDLEEYLVGVLAAEMPARFSLEALKAQAIAARTLTIRRLKRFGGKGCQHQPGVDLCDDPGESQAWLSDCEQQKRWGNRYYGFYHQRLRRAVRETSGIIMTYQNQPIDAVFHSTCGVGTATAKEVWQNEIPYLQSVSCGFDRHSPRYLNRAYFSYKDLCRKLGISEYAIKQLKVVRCSPQGRILVLAAGKYRLEGQTFRKTLGLTSTCLKWQKSQSGIYFESFGYGHGVGLCQFGADGMGKNGWGYQKILRHYYQGIQFSKIKY